ncbi:MULTISPECIES: hypothetical protein [Vibrio]|uniref:hypothetical protein n=1 Tax=Vibrio TaxID=662 RepID=UPI0011592CC3|nr:MULTISPECIES: hypothetical protein [Vibrio]TQP39249.1 hypothetical protein FLM09_19370 [Vibrio cholerae]TXX97139.1 hypothetical protein FXF05_20360 [Vibrio mimicus]
MKFIEKILIWSFLAIAVFLLFKSSDEPMISLLSDTLVEEVLYKFGLGNTIIFNLCIGYIVSLFFYFLVVVIPEKRKQKELTEELGQVISFMLEAFFHDRRDFSIVFHWSKHAINCKNINDHLKQFDRFKQDASYERLGEMKAICLVQSAHQILSTFEQLVPVAFQVSYKHAMIWISLTNSIRQIASLNDVELADRDWGILDLNLEEFVAYVGQFYDVS